MSVDLVPHVLFLIRECFEGRPAGKDYTWFVEGKEGIFDALESTGAEIASVKPSLECASIAAHTFHIRYALRGANAYLGGPEQEGDWESTWAKQEVSEEEWADLKADVRHQYEFFVKFFEANPSIEQEDHAIGFLAQLPHMAFHLGAIRQIMKIVQLPHLR